MSMSDMSDQEKVKFCAAAMGISVKWDAAQDQYFFRGEDDQPTLYDPLQNKEQAFEILERFQFDISSPVSNENQDWGALHDVSSDEEIIGCNKDLRRAIVDCAVLLHRTKLRALNG
jgi:hypothetical protein